MRKSILPLLLLAGGCGAAESPEFVVVDDFLATARAVSCEPVTLEPRVAAVELRSATDSTFLVLDEAQRQLLEFDHDLRLVWRVAYAETGPGAIGEPVSATLLGDTAVAVAGRSPLQLTVLSRSGAHVRSQPLDFIPHSVEATAAGDVLITPSPFGQKPPTLVLRYDGASLTGLPVPIRPYPDMIIRAIGNSALLESLPSGDALVVHQFLSPRAFRLGADDSIEPLRVPTPDATREQLAFVPTAPITEEHMRAMLTPGLGLAVDPLRSELYLLTRSGRMIGGRAERAVLRVDERLTLLDSYTLDAPAGRMVFLPHRRKLIVSDDMDRFYGCSLPPDAERHARAG